MKISTFLLLLPLFLFAGQAFANLRDTISLNEDWKFVYGYEVHMQAGKIVQLPHTWNSEDALSGKLDYYRGEGNYYKEIFIDSLWRGRRLFLRFDGANTVTDLFINSKYVGQHRGGYSAFLFEITDRVDYGKNNLFRIRVSNARQLDVMPQVGDFTFYGGIYRDLNLLITDEVCISPLDYASSGVYLEQKKVSEENAAVNARVLISNGSDRNETCRVTIEIRDGDRLVLSAESDISVARNSQATVSVPFELLYPKLWNGRENPFMYNVRVLLSRNGVLLDRVEQPLGLRYFRVDPEDGFFLNGKHLALKGVCRHQDREAKGNALSRQDHEEDMNIILEMGANAIRLSHYPHAPYFYDLLDKNGMIVWSEIPFVGPGGYRDQGFLDISAFRENGRQQLLEMIHQNFNRPSICFWGLFNELKFDEESPVEYLRELQLLTKSEDPSRLTVSASFIDKAEINEITDLIGWNKYFGWYTGAPEDLGAWVDQIHRQSPNLRIAISEYGAGASVKQHQQEIVKARSGSRWHPESWQAYCHEKNWQEISHRPYIWSSFVWNMFDFVAVHRDEGDRQGINDKGLVTFDRKIKKDAWWFYKAAWNESESVLYIADRRFTERESPVTYVKVYSNREKVELWVNGFAMGQKSVENAVVQWDGIQLKKGENLIEVRAENGAIRDSCRWNLR